MYSPPPKDRIESLQISEKEWLHGLTCVQPQSFWDQTDETVIHAPGIYHHGTVGGVRTPLRVSIRLVDLVQVKKRVIDEDSERIGVLISYMWGEMTIWMDDLVTNPSQSLRVFAAAGLWMSIKAAHIFQLASWIMDESQISDSWATLYHRTGWHKGGYRLPHAAFGIHHGALLPSPDIQGAGYGVSGSLADWRDTVGKAIKGNPILTFVVGVSLSGALLSPSGGEGGGFHLYGASGAGKSTALDVAVSVWGGGDFKRSWAATTNGKRALYASLSGACAVIDELHESPNPRGIEQEIYALNGVNKTRARSGGEMTTAAPYLLSMLSGGEVSIADFLASHGLPPLKDGAENRLTNILVTDRKYGVFDDTHGATPKAFSDQIKQSARQAYGSAGLAFAEQLVREISINSGFARVELEKIMTVFSAWPNHGRVARRFALPALAVELAVRWGIVPIGVGDGVQAAMLLFQNWLAYKKSDPTPCDAVHDHIHTRGALAAHIDDLYQKPMQSPIYRQAIDGRIHWLLSPRAMKEAFGGRWSTREGALFLFETGWLTKKESAPMYIKALGGSQRVYDIVIPERYVPPDTDDDRAEICVDPKSVQATGVTPLPVKSDPDYQHDDLAFLVWADDLSQREVSTCEEADHKSWVGGAPEFVEDDVETDGGAPEVSAVLTKQVSLVVTKDVPEVVRRSMGDVITEAVLSGGDSW